MLLLVVLNLSERRKIQEEPDRSSCSGKTHRKCNNGAFKSPDLKIFQSDLKKKKKPKTLFLINFCCLRLSACAHGPTTTKFNV